MQSTTDTIEITLNGEPCRITAGGTVSDLLNAMELHPRLIVVEHNRTILDRARFGETALRAGDVVELVHFVGGG